MSVFYYKYGTYFSSFFFSPLTFSWLAAFVTLNDETLASLIKQSTGGQEEKREREREDSSPSKKHKNPKWVNAKS